MMNRKAWIEVLQYVLLIAVLMVNIVVILNSQAETRKARETNKQRQVDMINHFDCVVLLTKKYPNINFQALNYDDSKRYLTECAEAM